MGWLTIWRVVGPIMLEHGGLAVRDWFKSRASQGHPQLVAPPGPDQLQLLAADVEQLKAYALELKSEIDTLNTAVAEREERLRRWLLALLVWNILMTLGLVLLAIFALRR